MDRQGLRQRRIGEDTREDHTDEGPGQPDGAQSDGGFLILFKIGLSLLVCPIIFVLVIDLLVEDPIDPEVFSLPPPPALDGPLAANQVLTQAERLLEGEVKGPESITVLHGHLYTGTMDGKVLHVHDGKVRVVTQLGVPPCGRFKDEHTCGRPLGMRFDVDGYLIVVDAYLGLFKVNVSTGEYETLFLSTTKINGKEPKFLNDLDLGSDGSIFLTDSSTTWDRRHHPMAILENRPQGRLLKFDPATKSMTVLKDGLYFANGVQLSPKEDFLLVAETSRCRILKYYLTGSKTGTTEVFVDNLPGLPDNIRASSSGGYWVGIVSHRNAQKFSIFDFTASWPSIRRITTKLLPQDTIIKMARVHYGLVVELDEGGQVVGSLHDPTGQVIPSVSEVEDVAGELYLGSFHSPFIGQINLRR